MKKKVTEYWFRKVRTFPGFFDLGWAIPMNWKGWLFISIMSALMAAIVIYFIIGFFFREFSTEQGMYFLFIMLPLMLIYFFIFFKKTKNK